MVSPEHDKLSGGHWIWDDSTAKAHYEFGVHLFGNAANSRYTRAQWYSQIVYYLRVVQPFVHPPVLTKEQTEEWT